MPTPPPPHYKSCETADGANNCKGRKSQTEPDQAWGQHQVPGEALTPDLLCPPDGGRRGQVTFLLWASVSPPIKCEGLTYVTQGSTG